MPASPYLLEPPCLISFSGGRTSAFMLAHVIDAYGGTLPEDVIACFANTGKEMPETLDFVEECGKRWDVEIVWLEYDPTGDQGRKFRRVNYHIASRAGEPYEALLRERKYLPNPVTRFCTTTLKIRVMRDFARSIGWEHWTNAVGLRHDEPRRVARINNQRERWETIAPLYEAGVTKEDVTAFWQAQAFDLGLATIDGKTPAGNCDLCYLKSAKVIASMLEADPALADWWIRMEEEARPSKPLGALFRKDRPNYRQMKSAVLSRRAMDFGEQDALSECFCHD
jgi:3'-phosphoadenosine 5'-phosphosulfate sulfotransferase (PAPS reductase)/FAD synthetase